MYPWDQDLIFLGTKIGILGPRSDMFVSKNMKFGLKWVYMARYELILRLDGALWFRIILKPLLTPKRAIQIKKWSKNIKFGPKWAHMARYKLILKQDGAI